MHRIFLSPPQRSTLVMLSGIAFFIVVFLFIPHSFFHSSGYWTTYEQIILYLTTEGTFGPEIYLAPGFPLMLSSISLIASLSPFVERIAQIIFFLLLLRVVFLIGKEVFRDVRIGYSAVFLMFLPAVTLQIFSLDALLFYTLLLTSGILFMWRGHIRHSRMYTALAGLVFGYAALTDPIGLYIPAIALIWFLLVSRKNISFTKLALFTSIFILSVLVLLAPWYVRNVTTFESIQNAPIIQKSVEKNVLFDSRIRFLVSSFFINKPLQATQTAVYMVSVPPDLAALDQNTSFRYKDAFVTFFKTGKLPAKFPIAVFFAKFFIVSTHILVMLLAFAGALLLRSKPITLLAATLLAYVLFATLSVGSLTQFLGISPLQEFVYPLYPLLYLFAACTLVAMYERLRRHNRIP